MPSVVTANDLRTGAIVYLAADGRWLPTLDGAAAAQSPDDLKRLEDLALQAAERNHVTAVYAFDVRLDEAGRPYPISVRERIRAATTPSR